MKSNAISCDLLVIGAGVAGTAAALFAAKRGLSTAIAGMTSQFDFVSGLMDLIGVHPETREALHCNPWDVITALKHAAPRHPYSRMDARIIRTAFDEYLDALSASGLVYHREPFGNIPVVTSAGTRKMTYAIPAGMAEGALALAHKRPCLLVDFEGLKGFSAVQIAESLRSHWPDIQTTRISLFNRPADRYPLAIAHKIESAETHARLAEDLRPLAQSAEVVGFPAVLGVSAANAVQADLARQLNRPVFEIPMLPPSIPGRRLAAALENILQAQNVLSYIPQRVLSAVVRSDGTFQCEIGCQDATVTLHSRAIVLATGRFFAKGLMATRKGLQETVFNLPVYQPDERSEWHHEDLLHPKGHPINQAGLETDANFRPVDKNGQPIYPSLYAAGAILAHQDWMRTKCGTGLSVATAFAAVNAFLNSETESAAHGTVSCCTN